MQLPHPALLSCRILTIGTHSPCHEKVQVSVYGEETSWQPASTTRCISEQVFKWFHPSTSSLPAEAPDKHCEANTSFPCSSLCKFLTHRICEHNKWLFFATKFWDATIETGREGNFLSLINDIFENPTATIIPNDEILKAFFRVKQWNNATHYHHF